MFARTIILTALLLTPAFAQQRPGVPAVIQPSRVDQGPSIKDEIRGAFASSYARRATPRFVLFWNREMSDEVTTQYQERINVTTTGRDKGSSLEETSSSDLGTSKLNESDALSRSSTDITYRAAERIKAPVNKRPALAERSDWKVEDAFKREMSRARVRFVDRTMAMRATAAREGVTDAPNLQELEISALAGKAELLMEVLQTEDPAAPLGLSFRIDVKDMNSGEVLASVVSSGQPLSRGKQRFVATSSGFERAAPPPVTLADVGEKLALEVMAALADTWQ